MLFRSPSAARCPRGTKFCDVQAFPAAAHLASWVGVCPGNHDSVAKTHNTNSAGRSGRVARAGNDRLRGSYLKDSVLCQSDPFNSYFPFSRLPSKSILQSPARPQIKRLAPVHAHNLRGSSRNSPETCFLPVSWPNSIFLPRVRVSRRGAPVAAEDTAIQETPWELQTH